MPPFWVTTKPPSDAGYAAFAPPPTVATSSIAPVAGSTRYSAPSATLVHTTSVPVHTGPSGKWIPVATISGPVLTSVRPRQLGNIT